VKERRYDYRLWQAQFKQTQALPQAQTITEEEIADEIAAYRAEKKHESAGRKE
jgi:hypothetical protein